MGKAKEPQGATRNFRPQTIQWSKEEYWFIEQGTNATGLYPHGFVKNLVRMTLGLPVIDSIRKSMEAYLDSL